MATAEKPRLAKGSLEATAGYLDLIAACWTPLRKIVVLAVLSIVAADVISSFFSSPHPLCAYTYSPIRPLPLPSDAQNIAGRTEHPGRREWPLPNSFPMTWCASSTWE